MCKASIYAARQRDAEKGENLDISMSKHGLGAFSQHGTSVDDCVTCVQDGTILTIKGIPLELQKKYGLSPMAVAEFIQTDHNHQDFFDFDNDKRGPINDFADKGVTAYVGRLEIVETAPIGKAEPPVRAREHAPLVA